MANEMVAPVEQDAVQLFDHPVTAVRLLDGRVAAVFTDLCRALDLDRSSQARRVRSDEVMAGELLLARVTNEGEAQPSEVLTAWAIPLWLTGIQVSRLTPAKREAILLFRREAANVLYRHFSQRHELLASAQSVVPSEPIAQPEAPMQGAAPAEWIRYHQQMIAFLEWQNDIEEWRGQVESRLEGVEEISRLVPEILERLGPQMLSSAHQSTVQNAVKRLHEASGAAYSTIYGELNRDFRVGKYTEIPEAQWSEVSAWFKKRLEAAAKRRGPGGPAAEAPTLFPIDE